MTVGEKCEKSGLQSEYKVVYNHPIAVTQACHPIFNCVTPTVIIEQEGSLQ
ncbi:hypothetical protein [Pseudomonas baetica]|uniref:hypothetical protein n=1 Tax=Pseudomonas baetica TaxID=674054 RepID=UPI0024073B77|nr:hypothetical protein [Pseudomonas baetica]MDF9777698.1 hypothetical protein [Pseudomonas baetica]